MAKKTCLACGCVIASEGYETGGITFCCEPCSNGGDNKKPEKKPKRKCKK